MLDNPVVVFEQDDLLEVVLYFVSSDRTYYTRTIDLCRSQCTPKWLRGCAEDSGALFACCPSKYGCRQFINADAERRLL